MEPWTLENGVPSGHTVLFEINRGAKAEVAARNIYAVYENNAVGESMARKWFSHFKDDCFDISDTPRSGRPLGFDEDRLNTMIHIRVLKNWQM